MKHTLTLTMAGIMMLALSSSWADEKDVLCGDMYYIGGGPSVDALRRGNAEIISEHMLKRPGTYMYNDGRFIKDCPNNGSAAPNCPPAVWTCPAPDVNAIAEKRKAQAMSGE